jgi:DNA-binding NtrC family response regulator
LGIFDYFFTDSFFTKKYEPLSGIGFHILEILKRVNWKVSGEKRAAKLLGLNATTLEARMKKLSIKREMQ